MKNRFFLAILMFLSASCFSQNNFVSVLDMNTSARLGGFGEVGVVSSPFYNNTGAYQNPALISKNRKSAGLNYSYMPWLSNLVDDISFSNLAGFYAIDSSNAIALNFTYLNLGDIQIRDESGSFIDENKAKEFYLKFAYSHSFSKTISAGAAFKYFRSDIFSSNYYGAESVNSIAFDLGMSYDKKYKLNNSSYLNVAFGIDITNFGPKISYTDEEDKSFIPTKLAIGLFINPDINLNDKFRLNIDLGYQAEKYLVPTSPVYGLEGEIVAGYDSDISSFKALYQSFYDAPGGFDEEINEIRHKFGSEFRFSFQDYMYIAFRHGRNIEHKTKGNRKYQTWGYGIGICGFTLDYMKIKSDENKNLDDTWAFAIGYVINLDKDFFRF